MTYAIRPATSADEPFLWEMLFYAAHMAEDGATSGEDAKTHPYLAKYACGWGRAGDVGAVAVDGRGQPIGAVWVRLLAGAEKNYAAIDDDVPELAIAVLPERIGQGIGERLLARLLAEAWPTYQAVVLSVREANPARRLYERSGFVVVETATNRVGGRSFVMLKQLDRTEKRESEIEGRG
ncbi:MAG TPA: GNAT family N-acetyltransferase [Roseiflexaceae bacterium]|nr:GNAT family N-acetyltransferase [Roseiflexaceae bacterium]